MSKTPSIILVNPQLGENIGTAARAMANFALPDLRIFDPRDGWPNAKARSSATKGDWIIDGASVHDKLEDALSDLNFVYATTARPRDMIKEVMTPDQAAADMHARIDGGQKVGVMFGRERWGLHNDEIALADVVVMAPVDPSHASLNIAQAVLLVGYEWYKPIAQSMGMGTQEAGPEIQTGLKMPETRPATKEEMVGMFEHLERELEAGGFFKTKEIRPKMEVNLRNMMGRAEFTEQEVRTFRGVISSLSRGRYKREKDN
ncbi:tRNA (cytidine(32)/uridine(32)-2'-O)-methyltransferase [hydrothermal vent metagenome]|uniref:tRNA (Cytidine(32)/uridine(32)-2'-O)-methyltransferase n=1 Tax=hydrothermal vent metagenome TaxID=652676 RepID=A0A3B0RZL2_9ZZZZ